MKRCGAVLLTVMTTGIAALAAQAPDAASLLPPAVAQALVRMTPVIAHVSEATVDTGRASKSSVKAGAIVGGVVGAVLGGASFYHFGRCDGRPNCARPSVAFVGAVLGAASGAALGAAVGSVIRKHRTASPSSPTNVDLADRAHPWLGDARREPPLRTPAQ